ncbi:bifunctional glycoside hydrolase 114/ polysaccharide deacetylase family protein [Halomonas sp. SH5A2]|uniref:bifunctional glycoside hydrolase 114/ polysaccharide deacetylase family protein n=1 Tax=Halomonas sp. SH5A2 TaxID=2749040 RepID=UPI001F0A3F72|nr:bifunctional glycoside hydrolase 114/ polysaccharide deacetylase family protein [Halomonas sp. SH5A2]
MANFIFRGWLLALSMVISALVQAAPASDQPSVAFYYGNDAPTELLSQFDWIVVEAANIDQEQARRLNQHGGQLFAYVSIGELDAWRETNTPIAEHAFVTRNDAWNSQVADLTAPEWQQWLIEEHVRPLWEAGYRGLFLDTLDSYRLFAPDGDAAGRQQDALVDIITRIKRQFPDMRLVLNRGFEILDRVHHDVDGVAAESLYRGWNPSTKVYGEVPADDQEWLYAQLSKVKDAYQLPAIAIDYVPANNRSLARATAERIHAEGFIPWVSVPHLNQMGVGLIEAMPRRVLILFDKAKTEAGELAYTNAHRYLAMPLEYLGYGAEYRDVNEPLPSDILHGRYAGVVTWFNESLMDAPHYAPWLQHQMENGLRAVIVGDPGVPLTGSLGSLMGVREVSGLAASSLTPLEHDDLVDFEGFPHPSPAPQTSYQILDSAITSHLTLSDDRQRRFSPILTGPWGGLASYPWIFEQASETQFRWNLDPFKFLQRALALPEMPIPDATTENGARYWMTQIDGDAFVSRADMPGTPFTGELMLSDILRRYQVPTTVSIIEGEIGPEGLYPGLRATLEPLARRIFSLPWVEVATHTFSHPFEWESLQENDLSGQGQTLANFNYNLPIPGYRFSLRREIEGSSDYINRELAPADKPVKVVLWTGNALPPEKALAIADELGLRNINGGNTSVTQSNPTMTKVSPMLRPLGRYLQVYAPQINENVYTNNMLGPLWGYRRAIETYQLTDLPRRLKPIDIYYHFYSAASPGALRALHQVYEYVLTQETLPLYTSAWSDVATQWYHTGIARRLDGGWQIKGANHMRTLRLPTDLGWPDLERSDGIAGVRDISAGRYIALSGDGSATLYTTTSQPQKPHLRYANGRITDWHASSPGQLSFGLASEKVPLKVELAAVQNCQVSAPGARIDQRENVIQLAFNRADAERIEVRCATR